MSLGELKLLDLLKADEASGLIHFKHRRMLIFDADAMGLLRMELIETLGPRTRAASSNTLRLRLRLSRCADFKGVV